MILVAASRTGANHWHKRQASARQQSCLYHQAALSRHRVPRSVSEGGAFPRHDGQLLYSTATSRNQVWPRFFFLSFLNSYPFTCTDESGYITPCSTVCTAYSILITQSQLCVINHLNEGMLPWSRPSLRSASKGWLQLMRGDGPCQWVRAWIMNYVSSENLRLALARAVRLRITPHHPAGFQSISFISTSHILQEVKTSG